MNGYISDLHVLRSGHSVRDLLVVSRGEEGEFSGYRVLRLFKEDPRWRKHLTPERAKLLNAGPVAQSRERVRTSQLECLVKKGLAFLMRNLGH